MNLLGTVAVKFDLVKPLILFLSLFVKVDQFVGVFELLDLRLLFLGFLCVVRAQVVVYRLDCSVVAFRSAFNSV
jgi:hypothetical protein